MSGQIMWKLKPIDEMTKEELLVVIREMAELMKADQDRYKKRLETIGTLLEPRKV